MNPYAVLAIAFTWLVSTAGMGYMAYDYGVSHTIAQQKKTEDLVRQVQDATTKAAADAIAKIKPRNVTIQQEVRREVETNTVYRDCRVPASGVRLANEALTGRPQPGPAGGELPGAGAADAKP